MARFAAHADDELAAFTVRRPAKRASATGWWLRVTTTCIVISGLLVLGDIVLGWTRKLGELDGRVSDPTPIAVFVGQSRLMIPANMFRFENQRAVGPQEHVELSVSWPEFGGYSPDRRGAFLDGSADAPILFVTIKRRDTATDSAGGSLTSTSTSSRTPRSRPRRAWSAGGSTRTRALPARRSSSRPARPSPSPPTAWRPTAAAIPPRASPRSTPGRTSRSRSASARASSATGARSATACVACS